MGTTICNCKEIRIVTPVDKLTVGFKKTLFGRSNSTVGGKSVRKPQLIDERSQEQSSLEAVTAIITSPSKTPEDVENILRTLNNHFIFKDLDIDSKMIILESVNHYSVGAKEIIFEQGQPGVCFFCVAKGRLEVLVNGEKTGTVLTPGKGFGELALLDDSPRTATIRTLEPCSLWGVDGKTFSTAIKKIKEANFQENKKFIYSIPLFSILTNTQKDFLSEALLTQKWNCGQSILNEGDDGDLFYIIKEGVVSCFENKVEKRKLTKGDYFGEQVLLYNKTRTATVVAVTDVKVLSINRDVLMQMLGNSLEYILYRNSQLIAIDKSPILRRLNKTQINSLIGGFVMVKYDPGKVVIKRGSLKNEKLVTLLKGSIRGPNSNISVHSCIGDESIYNEDSSENLIDYIALEETDTAEITKTELEACIGGNINYVTTCNEAAAIISKVQVFKSLSSTSILALAKALKICNYPDKSIIVEQDSEEDSFYIIKSGTVKVYKNELYIRDITKNDYFGERAALIDNLRTAAVVSNGPVECWVLHKQDFIEIIDPSIRNLLLKRIEFQDTQIELTDLYPIKSLGFGKFGNVILVAHKQKKTLFAIKSIHKSKISEFNLYESLKTEKNVLMQLDYSLIIKLVKTFKDPLRIYYLIEYVKGIDLFDLLIELDVIREDTAKFYVACFILTLEHLHERNIIHRDLKPENVMIDEEGYPRLIDFGTAKIVVGRTYTTVGTPHYIAPETLLRQGYTTTVDLWGLGVMMYEIIYGKVPFGAEDEDSKVIYDKILDHNLDLRLSPYEGSSYKSLIQQLLSVNPAARLGGGFDNLKAHPWFSTFNWERLSMKMLKAPHKPKIGKIDVDSGLMNVTIQDFIENIENAQLSKCKSNNFRNIPIGWDEEF